MRFDVVMPQMGESVAESTITKWYKEVGDHIEQDEVLLELSADKVDADVPSPVGGVIVELLYKAGETVEVNTKIAVIETEGEVSSDVAPPSKDVKPQENQQLNSATEVASERKKSPAKAASGGISAKVGFSDALKNSESMSAEEMRRVRSTPLVRKIAAEHGITSLSGIPGTGLSGRVTRDDILSYIEGGGAEQEEVEVVQKVCTHSHHPPIQPAAGGSLREIPALPPIKVYPNDQVEVLSPQRQAIARHMIASRATSPHAQTIHEVDFSAVFRSRAKLKHEYQSRNVKLTFTAYLVKAVAQALGEFPLVNCSLDGNDLIIRGDINVGIAVDIGDSLVVPVIKHADELSLIGISRAIEDLAARARSKKLMPDDMQAGTFTVSNHGIFGPEFGIPIINQPQTAIMSTGTIKKRIVVDQKTDAIMVRPTSFWCLSFDHRAIDGATADKFMARLREIIETWSD